MSTPLTASPDRPASIVDPTSGSGSSAAPARPSVAALVLLALLASAAFSNALRGAFLYDDYPYIVENPQVQQPTAHRLFGEPLTAESPQLGLYRPLVVASYAMQARGRGEEAPTWEFHALNVALHVGVTLLAFLLALRLGLPQVVALVGAALFAVHSVHVEPVDWIVGRAELLAALLGLAYVVLSLDANRTGARGRRVAAWACFAAACFSKESSFALPGVVVALEFARGARPRLLELVKRHAAEALILVVVACIRIDVIGRFGPDLGLGPYGHRSLLERVPVAANLLGEYFLRCVVPPPPRIFFHRSEFLGLHAGALAGLALYAAALALFRRDRGVRAALVAFPVALLTVLNLVPIQETLAERFLYLPSAFACLALGALVAAPLRRELAMRRRAALSLLPPVVAVALLLGATWYWNPIFDDALALWRHNVAQAPELPFPHYQAAYFLHQKKIWTARVADDTGAVEEYEEALRLNDALLAKGEEGMPPDQLMRSHLSLGDIYSTQLPAEHRDHARAERHLRQAITIGAHIESRLDPELGKSLLLLAWLRHVKPGVSQKDARNALLAATELPLSPELLAAAHEDLARLEKEIAETPDGR
jgi:tetratricopeptide (TPR) repeat protein